MTHIRVSVSQSIWYKFLEGVQSNHAGRATHQSRPLVNLKLPVADWLQIYFCFLQALELANQMSRRGLWSVRQAVQNREICTKRTINKLSLANIYNDMTQYPIFLSFDWYKFYQNLTNGHKTMVCQRSNVSVRWVRSLVLYVVQYYRI